MANIVSAVFPDRGDAERAVDWLRDSGCPDSAITVLARDESYTTTDYDKGVERKEDAKDAGKGALAGAGVGAGVGALFGLAAAAIPGIGPFITAGALANALGITGGAAAAGAIVGGTSGGIAGALSHWGLNEADSRYYAGEVERGGTYVGVDLSQTNLTETDVRAAFDRFNGTYEGYRKAA
jgi:hypothetical protein